MESLCRGLDAAVECEPVCPAFLGQRAGCVLSAVGVVCLCECQVCIVEMCCGWWVCLRGCVWGSWVGGLEGCFLVPPSVAFFPTSLSPF